MTKLQGRLWGLAALVAVAAGCDDDTAPADDGDDGSDEPMMDVDAGGDETQMDGGPPGDAGGDGDGEGDAASEPPLMHGLRGDYYDGTSFITYKYSRLDARMQFNFGPSSPDQLPVDMFSIRWLGFVEAATSGTYKFHVTADDGARLFIDGENVLEQGELAPEGAPWGLSNGDTFTSKGVYLEAGVKVPIRFEYFEHMGNGRVTLEWESPEAGVARQVVPTERLWALPAALLPPQVLTFEAEAPTNVATGSSVAQDPDAGVVLEGPPKQDSCVNCSGQLRVPLNPEPEAGSLTFKVEVPAAGDHVLQIWYVYKGPQAAIPYSAPARGTLSINGGDAHELVFPNNYNDTSVFDPIELHVSLAQGPNDITLAGLSEGAGTANIDRITLHPASAAQQGIAPLAPAQHGLRGDYYDRASFASRKFSRIDATVDFDFGEGSPDPEQELPGADSFSIRWLGYIVPEVSGIYTFYTSADDGERLWVGGRELADHWRTGGHEPAAAPSLALRAGEKYPVRLDMFEQAASASIKLEWEAAGAGIARQVVPSAVLWPASLERLPAARTTYEAEAALNTATGVSEDGESAGVPEDDNGCDGCSGALQVTLVTAPSSAGSIRFPVSVPEAAPYLLEIWYAYAGAEDGERYAEPATGTVTVNEGFAESVSFPNNYSAAAVLDPVEVTVELHPGSNTITLAGTSAGSGSLSIDRITLRAAEW